MDMESALQPADNVLARRQTFDGLDDAALDLADRGETGAHRFAVDQHRASAAVAGVATDLDAGQTAMLA